LKPPPKGGRLTVWDTEDPGLGIPRFTFHDLRRTARSLMSRVGVDQDVAERCLAHKLPGMRGIYDRHAYDAQKFAALTALADEISKIVGHNVVPMRKKTAQRR
jgi:integrase